MQRILFARIELWVVLLLLLIGVVLAILFGAAALEGERKSGFAPALTGAAVAVADVPRTIQRLLTDEPMLAFSKNRFPGKSGWSFPAGAEAARMPGWLLLSRYDGDAARHVVELWRLEDWTMLHRWQFDAGELYAGIPSDGWHLAQKSSWNPATFRAIHPFLTAEGGLVVKDHEAPLVEVDACGRIVWRNRTTLFHHSTESDGANGFWIPTVIEPQSVKGVSADFRDDGLGHVAADGTLLSNESVTQILIDNGFAARLFTAGHYSPDPVHLNDIEPVLADGPYWKKGDLFLSARHMSTVMLYRPSERRILWSRTGPWIAQHDVDILDDHRIAVLNNNAVDRRNLAVVDGVSGVMVYDFASDTVSEPYREPLAKAEARTLFEGLQTVLPDGGLLFEEENAGREMIFAPGGALTAEFVNRAKDGKIYRLGWSRWLAPGMPGVEKLAAASCGS